MARKFLAVEDEEFKNAQTAGGYAKEMSKEYQAKQAALTAEHIKKQDIVITTALIPGRPAPKLVSSEMVKSMKPGSVLVDLAVERGGNVEGAKAGEVVEVDGVKIVGYTNVAGRVAASASALYARNLFNFIETMIDKANKALAVNWDDELVKATALTKDGAVIHPNFQPKHRRRRHGASRAGRRSLRVPPVDFRARGVRRLFRGVVGDAGAAYAADVVTNAISSVIVVGALLAVGVGMISSRLGLGARFRFRRADLRLREYLRRLPGHPAHAGDVQEEVEMSGNQLGVKRQTGDLR